MPHDAGELCQKCCEGNYFLSFAFHPLQAWVLAVKAVKREKELSQRSTDVMRASTNEMHQPGQHTSSSPSRPGAEQLAEVRSPFNKGYGRIHG